MRFVAYIAGVAVLGFAMPVSAQSPVAPPPAPLKVPGSIPIPASNPGEWIAPDDYPPQALREEVEGRVSFTLAVDASGRVSGCRVTQSSGSAALDDATCTLIQQRAVFLPARDKKKNAVAGEFSSAVRWEMPKGPQPLPPESSAMIVFTVEKDGRITDCEFDVVNVPVEEQTCPPDGTFEIPVNAAGQPERRRLRTKFSVERVPIEVTSQKKAN